MIPAELMQAAKVMLRRDEGCQLVLYLCPAGKQTIGIGRNVEDRGLSHAEQQRLFDTTGLNKMECVERLKNRTISEEEALYLLENDIRDFWQGLNQHFEFFETLDTVRQLAMLNLGFNLGLGALLKFVNTVQALRDGDYEKAAEELINSKWFKQVGERAGRVVSMVFKGELPSAYQISGSIQLGL